MNANACNPFQIYKAKAVLAFGMALELTEAGPQDIRTFKARLQEAVRHLEAAEKWASEGELVQDLSFERITCG